MPHKLPFEHLIYSAPFPRVPDNIKAKYSIRNLSFRPFGIFEKDLDIDFKERSRPYLATEVLRCCTLDNNGDPPENAFFLDLTVGKRIECLLTLATLRGSSLLIFSTPCLNGACSQKMEIQISAQELADLQHLYDDSDQINIEFADKTISIRKPTGRDQLEWLRNSYQDEAEAIEVMIRTLILESGNVSSERESQRSDNWVQTLNNTFDEIDPLVNFRFLVNCPYCGMENQYEIDLEEISLQRLKDAQIRLLKSIHLIARHYHWNEKQFFSVPPWRRSQYLALIEKEISS